MSFDDAAFLGDELRQEAILRQLTVLGEAAKNVSAEFRAAHPEIPWQDLGRFRDLVVHRYRRLQLVKVWEIVTEDAVALTRQLEQLVPRQAEQRILGGARFGFLRGAPHGHADSATVPLADVPPFRSPPRPGLSSAPWSARMPSGPRDGEA